jgi:proline dehydrogenase
MGLARSVLLAASTSDWLRDRAVRLPMVRRSVSRFMPGERLDDALGAARTLYQSGVRSILTYLGENLARPEDTRRVVDHYVDAMTRASSESLEAQISVKLTQLGLDIDRELCAQNLEYLVERSDAMGTTLWIDMESSSYADLTLELFRRARRRSTRVGVALQAYLYRTPKDVEALLPLAPLVRLVKGAYLEPPSIAWPRKADVDRPFFELAVRLLGEEGRRAGARVHLATHDRALIDRLDAWGDQAGVDRSTYAHAMLYGIQRRLQERLVAEGHPLFVLISYGDNWFPWYMRRLAERPANLWFVVKGGWT